MTKISIEYPTMHIITSPGDHLEGVFDKIKKRVEVNAISEVSFRGRRGWKAKTIDASIRKLGKETKVSDLQGIEEATLCPIICADAVKEKILSMRKRPELLLKHFKIFRRKLRRKENLTIEVLSSIKALGWLSSDKDLAGKDFVVRRSDEEISEKIIGLVSEILSDFMYYIVHSSSPYRPQVDKMAYLSMLCKLYNMSPGLLIVFSVSPISILNGRVSHDYF